MCCNFKKILLNKFKIFNDPIYGFINIPSELIFDIIEHPYFQRLRRISQMGLSSYVYPGAHHTRFEHALGAMHLMQKTISILKNKSIEISKEEEEALLIAILLHDIGHGPFSHTLEHSLVTNSKHEDISIIFMEALNEEFDQKLSLAIKIFKGNYHRKFLNQLISGQLDMDRLDYLKRDSFYTGVTEGNINSERIISMLTVVDDSLVVEEKGIYSVEKFIVARRLMYWMVYLHKTSLVSDYLLVKILKRAKELFTSGLDLPCSKPMKFFLSSIQKMEFDTTHFKNFTRIDDYDVIMALKQWKDNNDYILSSLCSAILDRKLPKIIIQDDEFSEQQQQSIRDNVVLKIPLNENELRYFVDSGIIKNQAYDLHHNSVSILYKNGKIKDLTEASDHMNLLALTKPVVKHFMFYPKS